MTSRIWYYKYYVELEKNCLYWRNVKLSLILPFREELSAVRRTELVATVFTRETREGL